MQTGQCDSCLVELDTGEAVLACMRSIPQGRENLTVTVVSTDEAWEAMLARNAQGSFFVLNGVLRRRRRDRKDGK